MGSVFRHGRPVHLLRVRVPRSQMRQQAFTSTDDHRRLPTAGEKLAKGVKSGTRFCAGRHRISRDEPGTFGSRKAQNAPLSLGRRLSDRGDDRTVIEIQVAFVRAQRLQGAERRYRTMGEGLPHTQGGFTAHPGRIRIISL